MNRPLSTKLNMARAVPVLMYHHVSPAAGAVTVSPVHFADQMAMLAREGYTTLGARAFSEYLAGKRCAGEVGRAHLR